MADDACADLPHREHDHRLRSAATLTRAARMCAAMGDVARLEILELLFDGPHCVTELVAETGDSASLISQRLKILFNARLVARQRRGKHVFYALADEHVQAFVEQMFSHSEEDTE